jgi:hypothetical protein
MGMIGTRNMRSSKPCSTGVAESITRKYRVIVDRDTAMDSAMTSTVAPPCRRIATTLQSLKTTDFLPFRIPQDTHNYAYTKVCIYSHLHTTTAHLYIRIMKTQKRLHRIPEVLEKKGRSAYWLAKETGSSYNSIHAYMKNRTEPSLTKLVEIAKALGVKGSELLSF